MARIIKQGIIAADNYAARICSSTRFLSHLYYSFISLSFSSEKHGVLNGRVTYNKFFKQGLHHESMLRRNIHRLEKGLMMKHTREIFARDYIYETVKLFHRASERSSKMDHGCNPELVHWAHDVLAAYFERVGDDPSVYQAKKEFGIIGHWEDKNDRIPSLHRDVVKGPAPVKTESLLALSKRRKSTRWYRNRQVPREFIDRAIENASHAPSACNRQPFKFMVFDECELVRKILSLSYGTRGFEEDVPVVIVVIGKLSAFSDECDRHVIYIDASLASMSLIYALETMEIGTCCINWPDIKKRDRKMRLLLDLSPDERVIMLIALGYPDPDGMVGYSQKKSVEELRSYNLS
ncbi:MAG TPA: nitroreductase family protein [Thermoanaerobaculia bacterium]|nr:nitroreductase family protein [Thermoanaerobaculia bacterium]